MEQLSTSAWSFFIFSTIAQFLLLGILYASKLRQPDNSKSQASHGKLITTPSALGVNNIGKNLRKDYNPIFSRCESWQSLLINRLYVAIALQCSTAYVISTLLRDYPQFWSGLLPLGLIYGSAAIVYASWLREPDE